MKAVLCVLLVIAATSAAAGNLGQAHDFRVRTAEGGSFALADALEEGPVILDFWATWCAPCKIALPRWEALAERYAEHGVQLVAVSQDDPRSQPKILPYMRSQGFDFPALLDGDKQVGRKFRVTNLPTTFLIAADGTIVSHHVGYREGDERIVEAELRRLLDLDPVEGDSR
jgi:cytochrome c biogenesis protein CcmG/thiol:disulfide interchange protein DsbE